LDTFIFTGFVISTIGSSKDTSSLNNPYSFAFINLSSYISFNVGAADVDTTGAATVGAAKSESTSSYKNEFPRPLNKCPPLAAYCACTGTAY
jgi:hypothetical protein